MPHRFLPVTIPPKLVPLFGAFGVTKLIAVITPVEIGQYANALATGIVLIGGAYLYWWKQKSQAMREEGIRDDEAHRTSFQAKLDQLTKDAEESRLVANTAHDKAETSEKRATTAEAKATSAATDRDHIWQQLMEITNRLPNSICPFLDDGKAYCYGTKEPTPPSNPPTLTHVPDPQS